MNNQSRTHQNWYGPIPRRSSLSDGWYGPAKGGYKAGSERIPAGAWLAVAIVAAIAYGVMFVGAYVGY